MNRRSITLFFVAAGLVGLYVWRASGGFPLDDSWIHQSYGRNLALRGEWALIPGQPSAASTAPLYTVLLAVGYILRIPYLLWTHFLGILALWGLGVTGAALADRMAPHRRYAGWLAGLLLVGTWQLIWAGASGMETAFFAFWMTLLPLLIWHETRVDLNPALRPLLLRGFRFGLAASLAILTRPEGALMAALCGLVLLVIRPDGLRSLFIWVVGAAIGFLLFIIPYLLLNLSLAGSLLPNTSVAKQVQHAPLLAQPYPQRFWRMLFPLFVGGQIFLIPGLAAYPHLISRNSLHERLLAALLPLWFVGVIGLYAARLPASYQHGRYVMSALPALVIVGSVGMLHLITLARHQVLFRILSQTALGAAVLGMVVMAVGVGPSIYTRDVAVINEEMVAAASWIDANIPPDELLAIHDIGAVAYFTPRPILDIAGLVSPEAIPFINDADAMWDLLQARNAVYLMAFPDQIPGDDPTDPRLCEVFNTGGDTAIELGAANMSVYRLNWNRNC